MSRKNSQRIGSREGSEIFDRGQHSFTDILKNMRSDGRKNFDLPADDLARREWRHQLPQFHRRRCVWPNHGKPSVSSIRAKKKKHTKYSPIEPTEQKWWYWLLGHSLRPVLRGKFDRPTTQCPHSRVGDPAI